MKLKIRELEGLRSDLESKQKLLNLDIKHLKETIESQKVYFIHKKLL